uniref:Apolipoprotein L3 n=1 Tax=Nannospalax galili TaxID=1026970 RepID=A0A8C6W209_NANGA
MDPVLQKDSLSHALDLCCFRNEEAVLYKAVKELIELMATEDKVRLQRELQEQKRFLDAFPRLKRDLVEIIRQLHALADHIDEVHKGCTISNVVTDATSTASGFLGILGLVLAPMTVGGSLVLSTTGFGLGAVATLTGVATAIVEERSRQSNEAEARRLVSLAMNIMKEVIAMGKITCKLSTGTYYVIKNLKTFRQHVYAIRMARANPQVVADARTLMTNGRISAQRATHVQNTFKGTALAMTKKARIRGIATASIFLALDVYNLVRDSMLLYDGTKTETAETLREVAQKLEEKLRELVQIHRSLQLNSMMPLLKQYSSEWR